jgi:3D (Asp-Asp-Asp) domain-containing protein
MDKTTKVGIVGTSLLAAVLVATAVHSYSDLKKERNTIHDANLHLEQKQGEMKRQSDELQKQMKQLEDENRSLHQDVDALQAQLQQESEKPWLSFRATYYDANEASTGKSSGNPEYGITASGRYVEDNVTIAVDPSVIPLGSWVEVMFPDGRVEKRRADDTGGAIKGRHVDVYVPVCTSDYGVDQVKIRVLSQPRQHM